MACLPMMGVAQNTWESPQNETHQAETKKKALFDSNKKKTDAKYLAGAVPEVDGKVVFTLDKAVPNMNAEAIYDTLYNVMTALTKEPNQFPTSRIVVVNKGERTIAASYKEWLVFQNSFLSLDRTVFNYVLIAKIQDHHLTLTMERLNYQYETERSDAKGGLETRAEGWITDADGLNKKKTAPARYSGKFRVKTIDRKDYIFNKVCQALGIAD